MIVLHHPQGSQDWLNARVGVITASRFSDAIERVGGPDERQATYIDAVLAGVDELTARGLAGYTSKPNAAVINRAFSGQPLDEPGFSAIKYAWLIAVETIARKPLDETFVTYAMRRGRDLEPQARRAYELRTDNLVEEVSLVLTDDSRFGYSSDGFVEDDGMIEVKCPLACDKVGQAWENPAKAHLEYIDQINGGLWITGRKWCDLVIYCDWLAPVGKDLFVKRIYRDEAKIEKLEADLLRFMHMTDGYLQVLRRPAKMSGKPIDAENVDFTELVANPPAPWDEGLTTITPLDLKSSRAMKPAPITTPTGRSLATLPDDIFA